MDLKTICLDLKCGVLAFELYSKFNAYLCVFSFCLTVYKREATVTVHALWINCKVRTCMKTLLCQQVVMTIPSFLYFIGFFSSSCLSCEEGHMTAPILTILGYTQLLCSFFSNSSGRVDHLSYRCHLWLHSPKVFRY